MSPYSHYEIARARQQEIVSRALNSHYRHATRTTVSGHRSVRHRLVQAAAALGTFVAAASAVTVSEAHSSQSPIKRQASHISAQQLAREIRAFEAKGFVPTACIVRGTLMRNYSTGQSVTVTW